MIPPFHNFGPRTVLCLLLLATALLPARASQPAFPQMATLPLWFEENQGQAPASARFISRGPNYEFLLAPNEAQLVLRKTTRPASLLDRGHLTEPGSVSVRSIHIRFLGANPQAPIHAAGPLPGKINYFIGNVPARWHTSLATSARVEIQNLYPGINLVYYGNHQQLEYDLDVLPGADLSAIAIRFDGIDKATIDPQGDLVLTLGHDIVHQPCPAVYQSVNGIRQKLMGGYRLIDDHTVGFNVEAHNPNLPLILDPTLAYASYFGGAVADLAVSVKVDSSGSVYLAGGTLGSFAFTNSVGGFQTNFAGGKFDGDAFVAKFDSTLTNLVFFSYFGGTNDENAFDLAIDAANDVYLTGYTDSPDFPITNAFQVGLGGIANTNTHIFPIDAFVAELDPTGSNLIYSSFLGGSDADVGVGIAVDAAQNAYIAGYTYSANFVTGILTNLAFQPRIACKTNLSNAFIAKVGPGGGPTNLLYASYLGGTNIDQAEGIAVNPSLSDGLAFVTGFTTSTNFPITTNTAYQVGFNQSTNAAKLFRGIVPPQDAFITEIDTTQIGSNSLAYSTYLGGSNTDAGYRIIVDALTNVYVTGYTLSTNFASAAVSGGLSSGVSTNPSVIPFNSDVFLVKFNFASPPANPVYSIVFGGTNADVGWDVAVNSSNVYVVGVTESSNFPTANVSGYLRSTPTGGDDVFITAFTETTNGPLVSYSAVIGGSFTDAGYGVAADDAGNAYVVGRTYSPDFPTQVPFQPFLLSSNNAFLAKISTSTNALFLVTLQTLPPGLTLVVDGTITTNAVYPYVFSWAAGSIHSVDAPPVLGSVIGQGTNIQYVWASWSDGGTINHQIVAAPNASFTATFSTNFFLTMNVSNITVGATNGGAVNPGNGFFAAGSNVQISAIAPIDDTFAGWASDGSPGSFVGTNNPATITMDAPITQTALFAGPLTNRLTVVVSGVGSVTPNYNGKTLQVGHTYSMTAVPGAGYVFSSWSGGTNAITQTLTFTMQDGLVLQANFIPNPFIPLAGNYTGLFAETNLVRFTSSGLFTATVTSQGNFSARFQLAGKSYSISGTFDLSGFFSSVILRTGLNPLFVTLQLDFTSGDTITGQITDLSFLGNILGHRAAFSSAHHAPQAGRYTLSIPGSSTAVAQPGGNGYGSIVVDNSGNVQFSGTLGDGTSLSQRTFISSQGQWPLYALLYGGKGSIIGWLTFTNEVADDLSGQVNWFKPVQNGARFYPGGFTVQTEATGSAYAGTNGVPSLNLPAGNLVLENGNLPSNLTNAFTLSANNKITGTNKLSITIATSTGLFSGSVLNPNNRKTISVRGAVLQKQNIGLGFFQGTNQTGSVFLGP